MEMIKMAIKNKKLFDQLMYYLNNNTDKTVLIVTWNYQRARYICDILLNNLRNTKYYSVNVFDEIITNINNNQIIFITNANLHISMYKLLGSIFDCVYYDVIPEYDLNQEIRIRLNKHACLAIYDVSRDNNE